MSGDLVAFLLARLTEDRVRATLRDWHALDCEEIPRGEEGYSYPCDCGVPERLLAECDAKQRIIAEPWTGAAGDAEDDWRYGIHAPAHERVLRLLALPYTEHPDYDPAWRP